MGYRSDIKAVIYIPEPLVFHTFLAYAKAQTYKLDGTPYPVLDERDFRVDRAKCLIFLQYDGVKWYDSYPEVMAVHALLEKALDAGGSYRWIRLGEEDADNEQTYAGPNGDDLWDLIAFRREVVWEVTLPDPEEPPTSS